MLNLQTKHHSSGRNTGLPSQVKFYRVDIDEDKIAQTVAEAGVASVVRVLGKADAHVSFSSYISKKCGGILREGVSKC